MKSFLCNAYFRGAILALICLLTTSTAFAERGFDAPSEALLQDAASYAEAQRVDLDEAVRRLQLQQEIGELNAYLTKEMPETFAGLWIEHQPELRVVVRFTEEYGEKSLEETVAGKTLARLIDIRGAEYSLAELEGAQATAHHLGKSLEVLFDSEINVFENRVDLLVVEADKLRSRLSAAKMALPDGIEIVPVESLLQTEQAALHGGEDITGCTSGFNVRRNSDGELGTSTAAHCGNTQYALGTLLPFRGEDLEGNQDVQWHSACDIFDVSNDFESGIGLRNCTGTQHRNNQAVGSYVCKFGTTTGRTCGYIDSISVLPSTSVSNRQATFVRVTDNGADLSAGGDSGGPWFVENLAYGIHHGGYNGGTYDGDSVYMPINYISSLGVSVLTSDPGVCNLQPNAFFTWTNPYGAYVQFDASGSSDPDGSIVSYSWDFDDGSTTTTSSSQTSHYYPIEGNYFVRLTVTDNDGETDVYYDLISLCDGSRLCPI